MHLSAEWQILLCSREGFLDPRALIQE